MCGRYTHLYNWKQLHRLLGLLSPEVQIPLRYNVAPTQAAPVIRRDEAVGGAVLQNMQWGLIPSWAKDKAIGNALINARAETIDTKPAFRGAFQRRRCLVPISGFYEWRAIEGQKGKQPVYITPTDDEPWLVAGLCENWTSSNGEVIDSYTIITTTPNEMMQEFHDRMPVILRAPQASEWLGADRAGADPTKPAPSTDRLKALLVPFPAELMRSWLVSRAVNSPKNDTPACIQRAVIPAIGNLFDPMG